MLKPGTVWKAEYNAERVELVSDWWRLEAHAFFRALARTQRRRQQKRARRRMMEMPARLIANSLVEGQPVRLRGQIRYDPAVVMAAGSPGELARMVDEEREMPEMPDFSLVLSDGVVVAVAARDADVCDKLQVLDLWEDRQTHATCDHRTRTLFRQSRFRPGHVVEVAGIARRVVARDDAHSGGYRGGAVGWALEAAETLTLRFTGEADGVAPASR